MSGGLYLEDYQVGLTKFLSIGGEKCQLDKMLEEVSQQAGFVVRAPPDFIFERMNDFTELDGIASS